MLLGVEEGPAAWLAAVGTAAATLIAALSIAGVLWDRRRKVASGVTGWPVISDGVIEEVIVNNANEEPVFDVVARVIYKDETIEVQGPSTVPPGTTTLGAQTRHQVYACAADLNDPATPPRVALVFRDQAGRTWRRRSNGKLRRRRVNTGFVNEWQNALGELPPLLDTDGQSIDTRDARRKAVD
ncbi:MAG TPA: hypothetical protein VG455_16175 [Acidimicrobiales bacterium]|nr:hypothetical protein [Acidimicrobiales bacterium]